MKKEMIKAGVIKLLPHQKKCKFDKAWIGQCNHIINEINDYCLEHRELKCEVCGEQATHECEETFQLVCGALLCDNCTHDYNQTFFYAHKIKGENDDSVK